MSSRMGGHSSISARPPEKMGVTRQWTHTMNDGRVFGPYPKSTQRKVYKRSANAKRRRQDRDDGMTDDDSLWCRCGDLLKPGETICENCKQTDTDTGGTNDVGNND